MVDYEELKKLVLIRLEAMPSNIRISMGSAGTFSKEDLIEKVKNDEELGKVIVNMQIKYLQAMKSGFSNV